MYKKDDVVVGLIGISEQVCIVVDYVDMFVDKQVEERTYILKPYDYKFDHVSWGNSEFNTKRQQYETCLEEGLIRNIKVYDLDILLDG